MTATTHELHLAAAARLDTLPAVRRRLRTWLRANEVPDATADDIVLAAWEACANAVEHPHAVADAVYAVDAVATSSGVRVTVRDTGTWQAPQRNRPYRGFGLPLVEALMDGVTISSGDGGTEIVMSRRSERDS